MWPTNATNQTNTRVHACSTLDRVSAASRVPKHAVSEGYVKLNEPYCIYLHVVGQNDSHIA